MCKNNALKYSDELYDGLSKIIRYIVKILNDFYHITQLIRGEMDFCIIK